MSHFFHLFPLTTSLGDKSFIIEESTRGSLAGSRLLDYYLFPEVVHKKSSLFIILFSFDIRSLVHEWKINDQRRRPSRFILLFDFYFWEMLTGNRLINLEERNLPVKEFSREASRIINWQKGKFQETPMRCSNRLTPRLETQDKSRGIQKLTD